MCVRLRALNRESDAPIFFFRSLFWDGGEPVTQHTPCACTQMSRGGDLFENAPWEALGDVRAIIERLNGEGGDGERWYDESSGMWEGLVVKVIGSKQFISTDDGRFSEDSP